MNISFQYNWPLGSKQATISIGLISIEDGDSLFRVGCVSKKDLTKVFWQGSEEWMSSEEFIKTNFIAKSDDLVVINKKDKATNEITLKYKWDIAEDWPPDANGGSSVHVPYDF